MKVKPLADYLLIEPKSSKEAATPSGILIPETSKEKPQEGKVIATGPGKKDDEGEIIKMEVKAGDMVYYKKWGGNEIKLDNKEYLLVKEEDILAVIE